MRLSCSRHVPDPLSCYWFEVLVGFFAPPAPWFFPSCTWRGRGWRVPGGRWMSWFLLEQTCSGESRREEADHLRCMCGAEHIEHTLTRSLRLTVSLIYGHNGTTGGRFSNTQGPVRTMCSSTSLYVCPGTILRFDYTQRASEACLVAIVPAEAPVGLGASAVAEGSRSHPWNQEEHPPQAARRIRAWSGGLTRRPRSRYLRRYGVADWRRLGRVETCS